MAGAGADLRMKAPDPPDNNPAQTAGILFLARMLFFILRSIAPMPAIAIIDQV